MKGIIIAAGRGRRLMPYTGEQPKCFAELGGQRIIDWVLEALRGGGLNDIVFIAGYLAEVAQAAYPELTYRLNRDWESNNILASLFHAETDMEAGFVSSYADIVYSAEAVRGVLAHPGDIVLCVDRQWRSRYVERSQHPETDGEKVTVEGDRVTRVARDISSDAAVGEFIGLAKLTATGAAQLREAYHRVRQSVGDGPWRTAKSFPKSYLIDLYQELIDSGVAVFASFIDGGYYEIDTTEDYQIAQREWPAWVAQQRARS